MAKRTKKATVVATTPVPLASQGQTEATEATEAATEATEAATEATPPAALARVTEEYDKLLSFDNDKRSKVFSLWAGILHEGEATEAQYSAALEQVSLSRVEVDAMSVLDKAAKGLTATKALLVLIASIVEHAALYSVGAPRVTLGFDLAACQAALAAEADPHKALANLVSFGVEAAYAKRGRKAKEGGTVSANSRISAWVAAQDCAKAGDEFAKRFKKNKEGTGYNDMGAGIGGIGRFIPSKKGGGLVSYIFALASKDKGIASSALVQKLVKYNADKAAEAGLVQA